MSDLNHLWTRRSRFPRDYDSAFRTPRYASAIEGHSKRSTAKGWLALAVVAVLAILFAANYPGV